MSEAQYGEYLPKAYKDFSSEQSNVAAAYIGLAEAAHNAGPLDERSRRLVKLGIAIGSGSEGGVKSHTRQALAQGAASEELRHAVVLALTTVGLPKMIACRGWMEEVLSSTQ